MNNGSKDAPMATSIQTGNRRVVYLGPIHEGPRNDLPENQAFNIEVGPEPTHITDYPSEAFSPPPLVQDYTVSSQELRQGVVFDQSSDMKSMKQKSPYHIIDLFWLINPKYGRQQIPQDESHFCQISFNIDFGNLKISLFKIPNGALHGHILYLMSLQRLTSGTLYPSSIFNLIYTSKKFPKLETKDENSIEPTKFTCLEQLIQNTGETWQGNRPLCHFTINQNIKLHIRDPLSGTFFYEFKDWQKEALLHAAKFVVDNGYILTGKQNINNG